MADLYPISIYIIFSQVANISYRFLSCCRRAGVLSLEMNMTFLEMEMKELGRSTWNDTHNVTLLIRTPQVCIRHFADIRNLHG